MIRILTQLSTSIFLALLLSSTSVHAAGLVPLKLALIEYSDDPRYKDRVTDARYQAQPWGRLDTAVELAIRESKFTAKAKGFRFDLKTYSVDQLDEIPELITHLEAENTAFFLLDLPTVGVEKAVNASQPASTFLNISALDNKLRNAACSKNLLHVVPSRSMLTDAMAQNLVAKKWKEVLVLYGDSPEDQKILTSLEGSAKKFGLKLVDKRLYKLGSDPRLRYQNNIALLTAKGDYDVIYIVDSTGEFAVDVPFAVVQPRPVVGAAGLVADWWHWAWERNGAPQVNKRFIKKAKRHMTGYDWSAWMSVKLLAEAALRQEALNISQLRTDLLADDFKIDGAKGYPLNFRPWNNQLRQPVFLTSLNRVIAKAPVEGFLHPTNNLDVLGNDAGDGQCHLNREG